MSYLRIYLAALLGAVVHWFRQRRAWDRVRRSHNEWEDIW
jgi:hypothetical protein